MLANGGIGRKVELLGEMGAADLELQYPDRDRVHSMKGESLSRGVRRWIYSGPTSCSYGLK